MFCNCTWVYWAFVASAAASYMATFCGYLSTSLHSVLQADLINPKYRSGATYSGRHIFLFLNKLDVETALHRSSQVFRNIPTQKHVFAKQHTYEQQQNQAPEQGKVQSHWTVDHHREKENHSWSELSSGRNVSVHARPLLTKLDMPLNFHAMNR